MNIEYSMIGPYNLIMFLIWNANICSDTRRKWFTSGRRDDPDDTGNTRFFWEGNGQDIEGEQYWLKETDRTQEGDHILYYYDGL